MVSTKKKTPVTSGKYLHQLITTCYRRPLASARKSLLENIVAKQEIALLILSQTSPGFYVSAV